MTPAAQRQAKTAKAAAAQRRAAVPEASVWVAASAGTGKTKVLTDRVLALMLGGARPERLLCLTFTKAAAAEMANRLAETLGRWTALDDAELAGEVAALTGGDPAEETLAAARRLFARVLDAPGGIKIQTIHAFCQALLMRFPLEAEVPPHFQVLDERTAEEMLLSAREEVLARAGAPGAEGLAAEGLAAEGLAAAVAGITAYAAEQGVQDLIAELIRERARFTRLIQGAGGLGGLLARLCGHLGVREDDSEEAVLEEATADQAFDAMGLRLACEAMLSGGKKDQDHGTIVANWLATTPARRAARFRDYLGAFFKEGGEGDRFATLIHKEALARAPGADAILDGEARRLEALRARLRALAVSEATKALLVLGAEILLAYERHKQARGLLDYDDLILKTRDLLSLPDRAAWVLFKLDGGLDHILIDEAQDTNPEQWEVVRALSEEFFAGQGTRDWARTVFAVGDAKQSIYSFQRADPTGFERMRRFFAGRARAAGMAWDSIDLEVSFRSTAAVLRAVDSVFARAEARDGVGWEGEVIAHDPVRVGQAGLVELWPPAAPPERAKPDAWAPPGERSGAAGAEAKLARLIAGRIRRWTRDPAAAGDPDCRLASRGRRIVPGDVLILVRRRNVFVDELVRALKQSDVPVAGVDRMVLSEQLAVMDLMALGRALLLPEDDLTLATVLKGPLIGLDETALFDLAHRREGSLWDALRGAEDPRFAPAAARLAELRGRAGYLRPYELYARLLGPEGGRRKLLARLGPEAADPIEEFLSLALVYEREQTPSLQGFLHWLETGGQTVKRDMEQGGDAVRIMTVHGAKGLQAPIVFLPDTLQVPQPGRGLLWPEDPEGLLLWPIRKAFDGPLASAARARAAEEQEREYRRLLYVALTRAEDRLYICGWNTRQAARDGCWYRLAERGLRDIAEPVAFDFSDETAEGWAGPGLRLTSPQAAEAETTAEPLEAEPPPPPPAWLHEPIGVEPEPPRPLAPSRPAGEDPPVRSPLGPDQGRRFRRGLLIHRLLESLPDLAPGERAAAARRFLERPLLGLDAEAREEILGETLAVIEHPDFAPLFGPDSRAEVPVAGLVAGRGGPVVVSGQIDRLVVTGDAVLIVDYKTNRPPPETPDRVPALYRRQMAAYRALLAEIYPGRGVRCHLLWTDGPRIMQLSDDLLADHAP